MISPISMIAFLYYIKKGACGQEATGE